MKFRIVVVVVVPIVVNVVVVMVILAAYFWESDVRGCASRRTKGRKRRNIPCQLIRNCVVVLDLVDNFQHVLGDLF